jgi:acetyl esterase/lipase
VPMSSTESSCSRVMSALPWVRRQDDAVTSNLGENRPSNPDRPTELTNSAGDRWKARFRAPRVSLPTWAEDAPERCIYLSNSTGTFELHAWNRLTGEHRQVTDRPEGTRVATLDPTGEWIWWFDDDRGDEFGVWRRQPFAGGGDEAAAPGVEAGYPAGLALGRTGLAAVGRSGTGGTAIHLAGGDQPGRIVYEHEEDAQVVGFSHDETLLAINHSEHGDSRHPALRVFRLDPARAGDSADGPEVVGELWDGPGRALYGGGFAPVPGDSRLLVLHERAGRALPLIWDPLSGAEQELPIDLPGEVSADWYPDGSALLLLHSHRARDELFRFEPKTGELSRLPSPPGAIRGATARPNGTVEYLWSSTEEPPAIRSTSGETVLEPPGPQPPRSVPAENLLVDGPGGRVHALICRPESGAPPYPTIVSLHGGPAAHDEDSFSPDTAAWVDAGYAVVRVNYRGSDGYGAAWRDAIEGRPGLTELADVAAVRAAVVESGLADPERLVLTGGSWGGYLTLLGLGTQPDQWSLGIASVPVADFVAAYEDEMEGLRAYDRALFGGSPEELPELYRECSPITYVDNVQVPVLVVAGANDPRCPLRQIENYLSRLAELDRPHEVYRYDAGHGSLVVEERIRQQEAMLDFARRQLLEAVAQ